jgi:hypothetical protein
MFERYNHFFWIDADHNIHPAKDIEEWSIHYDDEHRVVAQTGNNQISVSTVFLGINHNFFGGNPPILFETMVFGGRLDYCQYRYYTYEEAVAGHDKVCEEVFGLVKHDKT